MSNFRVSHLLLLMAVVSALLGWLQLSLIWRHEKTITVLDSRTLDTEKGTVTQLYDRQLLVYSDSNECEVQAPPIRKFTGYCTVAISLALSRFGLRITRTRGPSLLRFIFATVWAMALAIMVIEVLLLIFWAFCGAYGILPSVQ